MFKKKEIIGFEFLFFSNFNALKIIPFKLKWF